MTVHLLPPEPPNERVVKRLRDMLEMAEKGELQAFVLAGVTREDGTMVVRAGRAASAPIVMALERAKLRVIGFVEDYDIDLELGGTNF